MATQKNDEITYGHEYWAGHDDAVRGVAMRWEQALTAPIPAPGVMNEPLESLYRRTEALRQRTWVGLTDEERMELYKQFTDSDQWTYEKAIEAKLKEKNTWVGLTDEDKKEYLAQDFGGNRLDAMDWAEKRLKEKNT